MTTKWLTPEQAIVKANLTVTSETLKSYISEQQGKTRFFITCYAKNAYKLAHIPCWVRKTAFNFDVLAFGKKSSL